MNQQQRKTTSSLLDSERPTRAVIYCRVSTSGQEDNYSLSTQEARCREHATAAGYEIVGVYREVHTGSELFERPEMTRMRQRLRDGSVQAVIVYALDRLSRNQTHLGFLLSEFDHLETKLELVSETIDDSPEGRLLQSVRAFVAEIERLKIRERSERGIRARVDSGKPIPGPRPPFGYQWKDDRKSEYILDPVKAPVARMIYDLVLSGKTLRSIANHLNDLAIPTPSGRGRHWEVATIHCVLKHPIYTGRVVAYRTKVVREQGKTRSIILPQNEWVDLPDNKAPRLVSDVEFEAVRRRLIYNKSVAPRHNSDPEGALLRCGIGRCGYCGYPLSVTKRKDRDHMYRCHPVGRVRQGCPSFGIMAPILDAAVWQRVVEVLTKPEIIAREVERRSSSDPFGQDIDALDRRLKDIEARRARLAKAVASVDDDEAVAPLMLELQYLAVDAKNISTERENLVLRAENSESERQKLHDLAAWCTQVAGKLPCLTYEEKRLILDALGVSVTLYRADHDPRWEIKMAPAPVETLGEDRHLFSGQMRSSMAIHRPIRSRSMG
jgi:site-specific DNA recombinase